MDIAYDDLHDSTQGLFLLHQKPFTGTTIDYFEDGRKMCEVSFKDGRMHGVARSWHQNGTKSDETHWLNGARHGKSCDWFENGEVKVEADFEYGVLMKKTEWDAEGNVIKRFERQDDSLYQKVLRRRAAEKRPP